jgi:Fe-S cluster assembly iron-binding protein IscA
MLELTENTIAAVKELTVSSRTAGLRIFAGDASRRDTTLAAAFVERPADGDQVVEEQDARVYLDRDAAVALGDKVLDAHVEEGRVHLAVLEQS